MAVELQSCRSDLQNTRIAAKESSRLAESTTATMKRRAALDQMASTTAAAQAANSVFVVRFDFASAKVLVPSELEVALLEAARKAPLVMLRGRTDGSTDSAAESRIARERAETVRDYLIAAGVPAGRIRATYQPVGDFATDNATAVGRDANRRVEIEVYRALPVLYAPTPAQAG
jgi:outer membrane protein OmpA-like peptidoglycan-associated protein